MKLRNKKTGEIVDLSEGFIEDAYNGEYIQIKPVVISNKEGYLYGSLAELNEEWEDVPEEEWRDVLGFEELYQVSNLGNVRTVKRGEATVMSQKEHWNGYLSVHLRNKGVERRASVHRLVAEAFIPNPDGLRDVNHKNGVKTDNRVENLEWLSHSDNMKHQYKVLKTGRYGHLYNPAESLIKDEPLIKDKKIRKAVRAWAEANDVEEVDYWNSDYRFQDAQGGSSIGFENKPIEKESRYGNDVYTITELCGEATDEA